MTGNKEQNAEPSGDTFEAMVHALMALHPFYHHPKGFGHRSNPTIWFRNAAKLHFPPYVTLEVAVSAKAAFNFLTGDRRK